jgi:1,2-phenylacetyl-CoA epoxidase PaaB subunit
MTRRIWECYARITSEQGTEYRKVYEVLAPDEETARARAQLMAKAENPGMRVEIRGAV